MRSFHPLDRPVWNALSGRQAVIAVGGGLSLRLAPDYGAFAAAADPSAASAAALAAFDIDEGGLWTVETAAFPVPPGLVATTRPTLYQMVAEAVAGTGDEGQAVDLREGDAADMLALATLTRPGPFRVHTHQMGQFIGIKVDGRLAAIAGERLKPDGFAEVSGVCTHPDYRGQGYAGLLTCMVAERILAPGETPFLHVYEANTGAVDLYRTLGFTIRRTMTLTVMEGGPA